MQINTFAFQAAALIVPLVFAIVFHEVAHGWTARMLGDPTAHDARRLSLNPLRHVDPVGTIILPAFLALIKAPVFGWAKPVPVNMERLRNPRVGMMIVAAAGPASNFLFAGAAAIMLGLLVRGGDMHTPSLGISFLMANLDNLIIINLFLGIFNLIPIPPFDGSHIVEGLLPDNAAQVYARLRPWGLILIFGLLLVLPILAPGLGIIRNIIIPPVEWAANHYYSLVRIIAGA